ncbi:hypothetical protein EPA93_07580 [Ktedonosporobacter rubrisoli]|uniref:Uncharacterized protein n=1 Tax=Ktedonosporobacter rubrisoli TaxID=2509675 RepID=A0A4P6JL24_KTERU|nr:hypothetical protein [Ktedonosporobacter rubrisoli]QBD75875.1 hypothetical protein EPA93_07580 [Ktedonosporobacter rubrisoli]
MSLTGIWNINIATPIGTQSVELELAESNGVVAGIARGNAETTPLLEPRLENNRLTWKQSITRPLRLNLTFDVIIDGDTLSGTSRAGKLPPSKVSGQRAIGE